jgi:hypothetical protein
MVKNTGVFSFRLGFRSLGQAMFQKPWTIPVAQREVLVVAIGYTMKKIRI